MNMELVFNSGLSPTCIDSHKWGKESYRYVLLPDVDIGIIIDDTDDDDEDDDAGAY